MKSYTSLAISDPAELNSLLNAAAYEKHCAERAS